MSTIADRNQPQARLLIADDHPLFRKGIHAMLATEEDLAVIEEAENGSEALELCRTLQPDLVLMDVNMPVMDGLEATRRIKEECPRTSILILTVLEDPDYLWQAIRAGAAGYALKITTPRELLTAVRKVLKGEFPIDQDLAMGVLRRLAEESHNNKERKELAPGRTPPENPSEAPSSLGESQRALLTAREVEILRLVAKGYTNRQIARELSVARNTARNHVQHIITKLGVSDRTQAAVQAIELGLLCSNHMREH